MSSLTNVKLAHGYRAPVNQSLMVKSFALKNKKCSKWIEIASLERSLFGDTTRTYFVYIILVELFVFLRYNYLLKCSLRVRAVGCHWHHGATLPDFFSGMEQRNKLLQGST